jgi:prephenate dehydratase
MNQKNDNIAIIRDNLRELDGRIALAEEQRQISLSLLASELLDDTDHTDALDIYTRFCSMLTVASGEDKIFICRRLAERAELLGEVENNMLSFSENTAAGSHEKVAYLRNRYNDEAFAYLTASMSNAKPVFASSFAGACEEVVDNRAEFCILPIEDSNDGKLFGFYSMLDRYDLKITSVCDVENEERGNTVRYALVGRGISKKELSAISRKKLPCSLEFSIISSDASFSGELISAARCCGATVKKINSLPVEYDENLRKFFLTLDISPDEIYPISLYLALEYSSYNFLGLYQKIKNN